MMNIHSRATIGWFIDEEDIVIPQGAHVIYKDKTTLQFEALQQHYDCGWRNSRTYPDLIFLIMPKLAS